MYIDFGEGQWYWVQFIKKLYILKQLQDEQCLN